MGLLSGCVAGVTGERLAGGVSSDIWRIAAPTGPICVKRALEKLKVAAEWHAPVSRNLFEARWMRRAARAAPGTVPRVLGQDEMCGMLAMENLPPETYPVWKTELYVGRADPAFAASVAEALGRIHADTAADPEVATKFQTDNIFRAIRIEPYLIAAACAHPDLAEALEALAAVTMAEKHALVHGDVSPKNILVGPAGPMFLDAECAWWGDPAFDVAFCLNHLLLKCLWNRHAQEAYLVCFAAFVAAYLRHVNWEAPAALERRAARLLPGLLLARVDGKSPVEYITRLEDKARVRRVARALLTEPADRLGTVCAVWSRALAQEG